MKDREYIERYLAGDPLAFEAVDGWLRRALASFRRRLGEAVDDVAGACHVELVRRLGAGEFYSEKGLKTYVWRMAQNRAIDHLRRQEGWDLLELDGVEQELVCPARSAAGDVEDRDLALHVLAAMPEECRRLWELIAWGFSYKEMAIRFEARAGTLRVRVRRCRERAEAYLTGLDLRA